MRLDDLVKLFNGEEVPIRRNGKETKGRRSWDMTIDTNVQCEIDGYMRSGKLRKAWFSGVKQTYTVRTVEGREVRATDIHPFKTEEGWKKLGELNPGDKVLVRGSQGSAGRKPKNRYEVIKLANHPYRTGKKRLVSVHRLVAEADLNGFSYDDWVSLIRSGSDLSGYEFLGTDVHVHHKDEDHLNNRLNNLEILSDAEHHAHHAEEFTSNVLHRAVFETVESIIPYGEEPTYDLELDTDPHNFTANGFVVHNTGKSAFVLSYAIKAKVPTLYFSADSDAFTQLSRSVQVLTGWDTEKATTAVRKEDIGDEVANELDELPIRFNYKASPSLDVIEESMMAYDALYEDYPALIVVDNITNVRTDSSEGDDPFSGLEGLMDYLHVMGRDTGACVVGLHHVTGQHNDGDKPIPLSGIKGQIGRVPEMVLTLHRVSDGYGPDSLNVSTVKNRGGKSDPSGKDFASLEFVGETMQIKDFGQ